jgi:hypothetical protein
MITVNVLKEVSKRLKRWKRKTFWTTYRNNTKMNLEATLNLVEELKETKLRSFNGRSN